MTESTILLNSGINEGADLLAFGTRFFISNLYIALLIAAILISKKLLKNVLSERTQYNLWFLLFALLAVPFLPVRFSGFLDLISLVPACVHAVFTSDEVVSLHAASNTGQRTILEKPIDFAVSVSSKTPSFLNILILGIWITGIAVMIVLLIRSWKRVRTLENSALPLQNEDVRALYNSCLLEMKIKQEIPVFSTAFLKSPVTVGFIKPRIYIPLHLISDFDKTELRFMLLHELQHYRHKDALVNHLMNLAGIIYWFNPMVWYALKEMKCDREIACDASVLKMLRESEYEAYGNTLINFAEKISLTPFPFTSGIGGNMKQIRRRIVNIAHFQKRTAFTKFRSILSYLLIAAILSGFAPLLTTYASNTEQYQFDKTDRNIEALNLSSHFSGYSGSFVLYDTKTDVWKIYNEKQASIRISPNSTYKIYDALLGLENEIITPDDSLMTWNGEDYPFDAWEADHDLHSAMQNSVNWYFQTIDSTAGAETVRNFLEEIEYGNQTIGDDLEMYWTDLSLKISPIEQVEMLQKFYENEFEFSAENIQAVKDSILLSDTASGTLYGKTGTGRIDGQDVNGWFIGYYETQNTVYYFAANIQGESDTTGSSAMKITLDILEDMGIWGGVTYISHIPPSFPSKPILIYWNILNSIVQDFISQILKTSILQKSDPQFVGNQGILTDQHFTHGIHCQCNCSILIFGYLCHFRNRGTKKSRRVVAAP